MFPTTLVIAAAFVAALVLLLALIQLGFSFKTEIEIPISAYKTVSGDDSLKPHTNNLGPWKVNGGYFVSYILEEGSIDITDAAISAGETYDGCRSAFSLFADGKKFFELKGRDTGRITSATLGRRVATHPYRLSSLADSLYDDALGVTTVDTPFFFKYMGPFPGGVITGKYYVNAVSDEFGGATNASLYNYAITVGIQKRTGFERLITCTAENVASPAEKMVQGVAIGFEVTALSSVSRFEINNVTISSDAVTFAKRMWNDRGGLVKYSGSVPTTMIGWFFETVHTVKVVQTAQATSFCTVYWAGTRADHYEVREV